MGPRVKETAEETRERISRVAEDLFRRMGFAKTAVADIAGELGMSPANVYRFFPSKTAIVQAICQRSLIEVEAAVADVARSDLPTDSKVEEVIVAILRYHRDNFLVEKRVHDMVMVALEHNWEAIEAHKERINQWVARILAEGIAQGIFVPHDPERVAYLIVGASIRFCHPVLVAQCIHDNLEAEARESTRFLLRAIAAGHRPG